MHFRRRRPRSRTPGNVKNMNSWPKWWDVVFHTRPARARARDIVRQIEHELVDPDEAVFDPLHKPHKYYW